VLLIAKGDQVAVYFNGHPAGYVQDSTFSDGEISLDFGGGMGSGGGVLNRFVIDRLKFWKLPGDLALAAAPTQAGGGSVQPTEDESDLPLWVQTFAQPLLNSISNRPPDFEDDFSSVRSEWMLQRDIERGQFISIEDFVKDGVLRYNNADFVGSNEDKYEKLYSTRIQAHDFIMQFDLSADNYASSADRELFSFTKKNVFGYYVNPLKNECQLGQWDTSYYFEKRPCVSGSWKEPHQITFISSADRFGVYMDGEPWGYVSGVPDTGLNNMFWLGGYSDTATFILDNFKFWNLDSQ
jgi:hypothetical protein